MNKYRRFKYPFGGETPQEFAAARQQYYENVGNSAMEAINATPVINANTITQPIDETSPREYLRQYTERVRPEIERKVNEMNRRPSGNGRIIRNHDKLYDYYKDGDKLYYRKKGGKNWIDISDNETAQKRINATIARNKRTYGKSKTEIENTTISDNINREEIVPAVSYTPAKSSYDIRKAVENSESKDKLRTKRNNEIIYGKNSDYFKRYSIYGDKYKTSSNKSNKSTSKPSKSRSGNPVTAINNSIFRNLYGNQEIVNNVIRQGGARSYKEYLNTPPTPTGYPKQAVIKQAPPKWRGR